MARHTQGKVRGAPPERRQTPAGVGKEADGPFGGPPGARSPKNGQAGENRKILVVSREPGFSDSVVDYAVNLADRLGYDLIAMNVGLFEVPAGRLASPYRRFLQSRFKRQARDAATRIAGKAKERELAFQHLVRFGDLGEQVENLNQEKRRIEFVLNATEASEAEMSKGVSLPVFTIQGDQGERIMGEDRKGRVWQLGAKTLGWGAVSAALYAAVFLNSSAVMSIFARGGWYAALPLATVFVFSFVHGAFSHQVWELLGIQAPRKATQPRPVAAKRPARRPRPRLRLNV